MSSHVLRVQQLDQVVRDPVADRLHALDLRLADRRRGVLAEARLDEAGSLERVRARTAEQLVELVGAGDEAEAHGAGDYRRWGPLVKRAAVWIQPPPGTVGAMVRVLLVDDHEVFLQGLVLLLAQDERLEVVGTATNGADGIQLADVLKPDVVLLDVVMPGMDGFETAERLREVVPGAAVVQISGLDEEAASSRAREAGAAAFITKAAAVDRLPEILVTVGGGEGRPSAPLP
jgi:CheY-like chemotaxis protein